MGAAVVRVLAEVRERSEKETRMRRERERGVEEEEVAISFSLVFLGPGIENWGFERFSGLC